MKCGQTLKQLKYNIFAASEKKSVFGLHQCVTAAAAEAVFKANTPVDFTTGRSHVCITGD